MFLPLAAAEPSYWPFAVLAICVGFIIIAIAKLRLHAFLALVLAAFLAGFLTQEFSASSIDRLPAALREEARQNHWIAAVELSSIEFGSAAGSIAISIGLASIIGLCLMESGGADKVVRRFLAIFGEKRAGFALLTSTYFLSIPIFFDTMFMLMIPLARALRLRTGKSYLCYVMSICCAAVLTHSLTVPHPGPLAMVANLHVDPGASLFWGIAAGILPALAGYAFIVWQDRRMEIPLRETSGASLQELQKIAEKPESELPSLWWSIAPVLVPILLIGAGTIIKLLGAYSDSSLAEASSPLSKIFAVLGNKNVALVIGAALGVWVVARQRSLSLTKIGGLLEGPLGTGAVIILITAAGGAFGAMLRHAGVGDAIKAVAAEYDMNVLVLGWLTSFVIRVAQGSATVAMLTTSAILWPMMDPAAGAVLGYHPMYVFLAIGFGAFACSWMNDSGFWVVGKLGGLTEAETLKTWTVMVTVLSVTGFIFTYIASKLLPLV
jgi:gluconate:H+ symporter, GntP family